PGFARPHLIPQDAAARLSAWEFVAYVISFLVYPLYYVSERVRVGNAFEVNRAIRSALE
ncbi:unnamed protein product, partial [Amoebophrya sp. A25]